ncbi:hypothetical protein GUITHDRAFT_107109 [Guillardia theta CCMP2712]|uniref:Protein kinase domain-containing protein n=2 Tax=Guillardia theta TaxID=55529 RepID=L1JF79_GUITC|nr:hypothetical protein GUITHDRAFT_107109 [Guillardia theta CCMP2712]EKX47198.1 hypothetical protein GUITHDRAFT_107109 [Guillardia theta CCMP2712]|eukprot:XP_005834178.1 hypothetical protein GUITHDRAFT_107109 [Guillardia theta CCMP2712]
MPGLPRSPNEKRRNLNEAQQWDRGILYDTEKIHLNILIWLFCSFMANAGDVSNNCLDGRASCLSQIKEAKSQNVLYSDEEVIEEDRFHLPEGDVCLLCDEQRTCPKRYEVVAPLGKGVYSNVYKCKVEDTNTTAALKISRSGKSYVTAAKRELQILKILRGQNGIVKYQDAFEYLGHVCIVMDLHGITLKTYLKERGPVPDADLLDIASQLFGAVSFMHLRNVIHTDIKPDNIVLVHDPSKAAEGDRLRIKLIDFASAIVDNQWHPPLAGTPEYRAPECDLHAGWSFPMDVWSVGCVLYELRSKKKLYKACVPCNIRFRMIEIITGKQIPEHVLRAAYKRRKRHADETLLRGEQGDVCLAPLSEEDGQDARARADVILSVLSDSQDFKDLFLRCIEPDPLQRMKAAAFREHAFFEPLGLAPDPEEACRQDDEDCPAEGSGPSTALGQLDGIFDAAKQYVAEVLDVTQVQQAVKNLRSMTRWL